MQAFTSAVFRSSDIQIPRETCLPLRPTMVFGPAPKGTAAPAAAPAAVEEKAAPSKPVKSIPVPEKRESRPAEMKPSRSEVRILPVRVKEESPARQKEPGRPAEPAKPAPAKESATAAVKEPAAATAKETPVEKPKASTPPVVIRPPAPGEAKNRGASPAKEPAKEPARAAEPARPAEEPDLLGLPKLSFQPSENFWTRLPVAVRIGAVAGCLAVVIGGIMLTSRGSGSAKPTPAVDQETQVVEAGSALANTAGWAQDWFADRTGAKQGRHVDVLRGSLSMRDYRMRFEGQIEQGALGWVFRANDKSFYVEKIQVVTPGREPVVALVRFAVIDGQEQQRTQIPLAIKAHLDTMYKVRMDVVGSRFTTWVQDEKVDQWTDTQIGAGGVGLYYDSGDSAKLRDTLNVIPLVQRNRRSKQCRTATDNRFSSSTTSWWSGSCAATRRTPPQSRSGRRSSSALADGGQAGVVGAPRRSGERAGRRGGARRESGRSVFRTGPPAFRTAKMGRGGALLQQGDRSGSESWPPRATTWAWLWSGNPNLRKPHKHLRRPLNLDPKRWQAQAGRGMCLLHLGKAEEALACFDRALQETPNQDRSLFGKAVALHQLGRLDEASEIYRKLLPGNANSPELLGNMIAIASTRKDDNRAKELSERLLKIRPQSRHALEGLARRSVVAGRLQRRGATLLAAW